MKTRNYIKFIKLAVESTTQNYINFTDHPNIQFVDLQVYAIFILKEDLKFPLRWI